MQLCDYGCGNEGIFYFKYTNKWCCSKSQNSCKAVRDKLKNSSKIGRDKCKLLWQERYGVDHPKKSEEIMDKHKKLLMDSQGVTNVFQREDVKKKTKNTLLERYGVEHPLQNNELLMKSRDTLEKNYGVREVVWSPVLNEKCLLKRFKHKDYILPSGRVIKLQGYEPLVLDELLRSGFRESDFEFDISKKPKIEYVYKNKKHNYYCDFYIPRLNWIIEVKSLWTLKGKDNSFWYKNLEKRTACLKAGYRFNFIIR